MQIVMLTKSRGRRGAYDLGRPHAFLFVAVIFSMLFASAMFGGYRWGVAVTQPEAELVSTSLESELLSQREMVGSGIERAREHMNALALRLGQMQAHVLRLDALGERLTELAKLDKGEFNFSESPALGGPSDIGVRRDIAVPDFMQSLQQLARQLEDRERQLGVLESLLMNRNLQAEVFPAGLPLIKGWISSYFGMRTDPFTGRLDHHEGVDIAGKEGTSIIAVASGVVTWSGPRYGYGVMVELNHGNGYITRYAHNKSNIVSVGDTIKKGQKVAVLGSTGRSTGPHVHFEVLRNGRAVNPMPYLRASR